MENELQKRARQRIARVNPCKPTDDDSLICDMLIRLDDLARGDRMAESLVDLMSAVGKPGDPHWRWLIRSDGLLGYFVNIHPDTPKPDHNKLAFACWASSIEKAVQGSLTSFQAHLNGLLDQSPSTLSDNAILTAKAVGLASDDELQAAREEGAKRGGEWSKYILEWSKRIVEKYDGH